MLDAVQELVWEGQRRQGRYAHRGVLGSSLYSRLLSWTLKGAGAHKQHPAGCINDSPAPTAFSAPHVEREALVLLAAAHLRASAHKGGAPVDEVVAAAAAAAAAAVASRLAACKLSSALKEADAAAAAKAVGSPSSEAVGGGGKEEGGDEVEVLIDQLAEAQYLFGSALMTLAALLPGSDQAALQLVSDQAAHQPASAQGAPSAEPVAHGTSLVGSRDDLSMLALTAPCGDPNSGARRRSLLLGAIRCLARASQLLPNDAGAPFRAAMLHAMSALGDGEAASGAVREAKRSGPLEVEEAVDFLPLAEDDGRGLPSIASPGKAEKAETEAEAPLSYCLVTVDGRPHEGPQAGLPKHPFGLSQVFYDSKELPGQQQQAWCMLSDGSCMWRQSASEIQIYALQVPQDLPARRLCVTLGPHVLDVGREALPAVSPPGPELFFMVTPSDVRPQPFSVSHPSPMPSSHHTCTCTR